jgi:hypothetical protein
MRIRQTPRGSVLCEAAVRVNAQTQNEANPLKKLIRTDSKIFSLSFTRSWGLYRRVAGHFLLALDGTSPKSQHFF